jgi:hypothetical protein
MKHPEPEQRKRYGTAGIKIAGSSPAITLEEANVRNNAPPASCPGLTRA